MDRCDWLFLNATTITSDGQSLYRQAIAVRDGLILWCGDEADLPASLQEGAQAIEYCEGSLVTPGLIDCHTHLVYAGDRADEFKMRLEGVRYAEIARQGGGILSTVDKTRAASEAALFDQSLPRLQAMVNEGVTTVEIKSGYGLTVADELKMLRVARRLGQESGIRVKTTFLGAHALPLEFKSDPQGYINHLCEEMLPAVAAEGLADAVDVFCESIGFNLEQTAQLFEKATSLGLPIKCHAEQLSQMGASALAAQYHALSCDHLEYLNETGAHAMAKAGTIAVLLPGAYYFLAETQKPPVELLKKHGVGISIATDCNPGSSPTTSLLLMMSMACRFFGLTIADALSAVTYQAARALGIAEQTGRISQGLAADLVKWSVSDSALLCYQFGSPLANRTMIAGQWLK